MTRTPGMASRLPTRFGASEGDGGGVEAGLPIVASQRAVGSRRPGRCAGRRSHLRKAGYVPAAGVNVRAAGPVPIGKLS